MIAATRRRTAACRRAASCDSRRSTTQPRSTDAARIAASTSGPVVHDERVVESQRVEAVGGGDRVAHEVLVPTLARRRAPAARRPRGSDRSPSTKSTRPTPGISTCDGERDAEPIAGAPAAAIRARCPRPHRAKSTSQRSGLGICDARSRASVDASTSRRFRIADSRATKNASSPMHSSSCASASTSATRPAATSAAPQWLTQVQSTCAQACPCGGSATCTRSSIGEHPESRRRALRMTQPSTPPWATAVRTFGRARRPCTYTPSRTRMISPRANRRRSECASMPTRGEFSGSRDSSESGARRRLNCGSMKHAPSPSVSSDRPRGATCSCRVSRARAVGDRCRGGVGRRSSAAVVRGAYDDAPLHEAARRRIADARRLRASGRGSAGCRRGVRGGRSGGSGSRCPCGRRARRPRGRRRRAASSRSIDGA